MKRRIILLCILILGSVTADVKADTVYLKNGKEFECMVIEETSDSCIVEMYGGTIAFDRREIQSISYDDPARAPKDSIEKDTVLDDEDIYDFSSTYTSDATDSSETITVTATPVFKSASSVTIKDYLKNSLGNVDISQVAMPALLSVLGIAVLCFIIGFLLTPRKSSFEPAPTYNPYDPHTHQQFPQGLQRVKADGRLVGLPFGVKIARILNFITAAFCVVVLLGIIGYTLLSSLGIVKMKTAEITLLVLSFGFNVIALSIFAWLFRGLGRYNQAARRVQIFFSIIGLLLFPVGTLLHAIVLHSLFKSDVKEAYKLGMPPG